MTFEKHDKSVEKLIRYINKCIQDRNDGNDTFSKEACDLLITSSNILNNHKLQIMDICVNSRKLTQINRKIFSYNEKIKQDAKHEKSMHKFKNQEDNKVLCQDFLDFEKYVYSLLSTKTYKSKISKSNVKVKLLDINNLFGYDDKETHKDIIQQGRLFLWEGLKKYGKFPEKAKNFNGRLDNGYERKKSSKSTFVFKNLANHYRNLGIKASSEKFTSGVPVELTPTIVGENDE